MSPLPGEFHESAGTLAALKDGPGSLQDILTLSLYMCLVCIISRTHSLSQNRRRGGKVDVDDIASCLCIIM